MWLSLETGPSVQFSLSVVSDSLWPHGLQPTRLLCPWDFPGKSTGVCYHCLLLFLTCCCCCWVTSVVSNSVRPHESQHARPPCPSPTPRAWSNSHPSSRWCHPTISFSVVPFSSCLQSFPASGPFPLSQFFTSSGQSISFSFSISPSNEYSGLGSFRMDWLDLLAVQGTLKGLLPHHSSKASILQCSAFLYGPTLTSIHDSWINHSFD